MRCDVMGQCPRCIWVPFADEYISGRRGKKMDTMICKNTKAFFFFFFFFLIHADIWVRFPFKQETQQQDVPDRGDPVLNLRLHFSPPPPEPTAQSC